jgi:hypothetical protein
MYGTQSIGNLKDFKLQFLFNRVKCRAGCQCLERHLMNGNRQPFFYLDQELPAIYVYKNIFYLVTQFLKETARSVIRIQTLPSICSDQRALIYFLKII